MSRIFIPTTNAGKLREFNHALSASDIECIGNKEARVLLGGDFDWKIPIEDRHTFCGNGCKKLIEAVRVFPKLSVMGVNSVLVDDSGLCVSRLNFEPGVHSATYAGEPRCDKRNREFLAEKLKSELNLSDSDSEPAFFVCSLLRATPFKDAAHMSSSKPLSFSDLIGQLELVEAEIMRQLSARLYLVSTAAYSFKQLVCSGEGLFLVQLVMGFCAGRVGVKEQNLLEGEGHGYDAMFFPSQKPSLSFASIPLAEKNLMSHRSEALRGLSVSEKSHSALGEIQELF